MIDLIFYLLMGFITYKAWVVSLQELGITLANKELAVAQIVFMTLWIAFLTSFFIIAIILLLDGGINKC